MLCTVGPEILLKSPSEKIPSVNHLQMHFTSRWPESIWNAWGLGNCQNRALPEQYNGYYIKKLNHWKNHFWKLIASFRSSFYVWVCFFSYFVEWGVSSNATYSRQKFGNRLKKFDSTWPEVFQKQIALCGVRRGWTAHSLPLFLHLRGLFSVILGACALCRRPLPWRRYEKGHFWTGFSKQKLSLAKVTDLGSVLKLRIFSKKEGTQVDRYSAKFTVFGTFVDRLSVARFQRSFFHFVNTITRELILGPQLNNTIWHQESLQEATTCPRLHNWEIAKVATCKPQQFWKM